MWGQCNAYCISRDILLVTSLEKQQETNLLLWTETTVKQDAYESVKQIFFVQQVQQVKFILILYFLLFLLLIV